MKWTRCQVADMCRKLLSGVNIVATAMMCAPAVSVESVPDFILACREDNDLYRVLNANRVNCVRYGTAKQAVEAASEKTGVLILADEYPGKATAVEDSVYSEAARKNLRLYVEFPGTLPGMKVGPVFTQDQYLRGVITSDFFGPELPSMRILAINGLTLCRVSTEKVHMAAAVVAGFDTAVFGLPSNSVPLLFECPTGNVLVATTKLSHFVTGRYVPAQDWRTVWLGVLSWLQPRQACRRLKRPVPSNEGTQE
jgi:hypothetical protein